MAGGGGAGDITYRVLFTDGVEAMVAILFIAGELNIVVFEQNVREDPGSQLIQVNQRENEDWNVPGSSSQPPIFEPANLPPPPPATPPTPIPEDKANQKTILEVLEHPADEDTHDHRWVLHLEDELPPFHNQRKQEKHLLTRIVNGGGLIKRSIEETMKLIKNALD
ncbi:unnamed protein product [Colias eurytheme]|nr:unnamed protein product [Colias eurytheme]